MKFFPLLIALSTGMAQAEVPRVATDIAPVHSLVSLVMGDIGEPDLIIDPGASPHSYRLRPSGAEALQEADLVVWIGPELTPWLATAFCALAEEAQIVTLLDLEETARLATRDAAIVGQDKEAHHRHGPGDDEHTLDDPHAWLSPSNAGLWLGIIAEHLASLDPENAGRYRENAQSARDQLTLQSQEAATRLAHVRGRPFVVFHDAYQYFEFAFDLPSAGAILIGDAADPSPGRVADLRDLIADQQIVCALAEPQFNPNLLATVTEGSGAKTAVIDPLGVSIEPGPDLYPDLVEGLVSALEDCLS